MTRAEAAAEVAERLSGLLAEAGMAATDAAGGLKAPLDDALAAMGVARADRATATPVDGDRFVAEALYQALRAILRSLATSFDVSTGGDSYRLRQVFENAKALLAEAAEAVAAFRPGAWTGTIDLGFVATGAPGAEYALGDRTW